MMSIPGDSKKPQIIPDTQQQDDSYEEPSINPPVMKKKKGITINEMLQNDLETDEEKLQRHQQALEEEKQRISDLIKKKNQESDKSIAQSDEEELLRLNYQVKASEDSNEYNNLSYNQEVMSSNQYQNDLAMLDESYTGPNEGGFNGYSSMKKSENNNMMNDSRPSSSPRNNNLMRTYDSLAMTQQFNYGFNYNTSGGGAEVLSQNSVLATSIIEKVVNEGSEKGEENMQYQSQKSFDIEVSQEQRVEDGATGEVEQEEPNQDEIDTEEHKEEEIHAHDVQDTIPQLSGSDEVKHQEQEEIFENKEQLEDKQMIDQENLIEHQNEPDGSDKFINTEIIDAHAAEDNNGTEEEKIQVEEEKEQFQLDTLITDHDILPDQKQVQESSLKQELILDEHSTENAQISDYEQTNIKNEESTSEVKEHSSQSQLNQIEEADHSLGLKDNKHQVESQNHEDHQSEDEQIVSQNHLLQTSLSKQDLENEKFEVEKRQDQEQVQQEIDDLDVGELEEQNQLSATQKSLEELQQEVQQENDDGNDSEESQPAATQDEEQNQIHHQNDIEEIASDQGTSEKHEETKSHQEDLQEMQPNEVDNTLDEQVQSSSALDQHQHQKSIENDQEAINEEIQELNQSPKSAQQPIETSENEDQGIKDQTSEEIQQIQILDPDHNEALIELGEHDQQTNSDELQELSQQKSPQSLQESPRPHENKESVISQDDRIPIQQILEEQKDIQESESNKSLQNLVDLKEHQEDSIEVNSEEEDNLQQQEENQILQVPNPTDNHDSKSEDLQENLKQSQADSEPEQPDLQETKQQAEQILDQDHENEKSQTPQSRKNQTLSQHSENSIDAQSEGQQNFPEEDEEEQNIIQVSSQKSKDDQSNEDGFFQPAQDQKISAVDFDEEGDLGNSFSQPNSFQQSSDTIKLMFDALDNNQFKYKSMSKRNLQIEIPETEYSGDENATVNQEEVNQPEGYQHQVENEEEESLEHHQVELPLEGEEDGDEVQSEHSEYEEESSAEQEVQNQDDQQQQPDEDTQQVLSQKQSTPNQSEFEQEELFEGEELKHQESPKVSEEKQIATPKESSQSDQPEEEVHIADAQIQLNHDQYDKSNHEAEVISQTEELQEQDQAQQMKSIKKSFSAKSQSQNESIQSIEKQKSLNKSNSSVSQKQLSRKSSVQIVSEKEASQTSQKQQSQQDKNDEIPEIEQPLFEEINSSNHSSNHSFKKNNFENQQEQSVRSPLNQLESLHDLKDYSIEDYVAEQNDIEMRHKKLNNDMYNLLSHDQVTTNNIDEYKSPKNNLESLSQISERNATDGQFFYRDGTARDSEENRDNMMIIGDDMSSNGGNNFRQQQHQDNEDRYGNIGKWELEKKENDINEIESLNFSDKREEFPDQHYQSNSQTQPEDSGKVTEEPLKGEQMPIYNSPDKNVEEINLFDHKKDSKSSINIAPRPPSTENRQKSSIVAKPAKKQQVQEKRGIQKIKDLFNSEEKYQLYERLHSKETLSSQRKKKAFEQDDSAKKSSQMTFKPKIDAKSNILSTSQLDETKLTQRAIDPCIFLYHKGVQLRKEKQDVLEAQKKLKEDELEKQCTFKPNIGQINLEKALPNSMYKRNQYWEEQRKKKIAEEQKKIKDQELDGCTFTPQIQAHSLQQLRSVRQDDDYQYESMPVKSQRTSRSRNAKNLTQVQSLASERSVKVFIERQERAKQQKIEKNAVFTKNNGSNWKNEVTKPRPPKITDIIISNLQKKLSNKFIPQGDISKQQYSSRRKSKDLQLPRNMTQQHSREGSIIEGVDQDIMIFDDADNLSTYKKPKQSQSNAEFKEQVKFLRQALHSLDLDQ